MDGAGKRLSGASFLLRQLAKAKSRKIWPQKE
jgi:hypothetical protein